MADIAQELHDLITTTRGDVMKASIIGALEKIYFERRSWIIPDEEEDGDDGEED